MKQRLPEHFILQIASTLAPEVRLIVLWALKQDAKIAKNDTLRSIDFTKYIEGYAVNDRLENSATHPPSSVI